MKYAIFLVLIILFTPNAGFAAAESQEDSPEERINTSTKINSILLKWQSAENQEQFAKSNNLLYKEGKIQVYIHLTDKEFFSQISSQFEVVASDDKIAVAYVSPEQLDEFDNLDYVDKVTPPDLARTNPVPQIVTSEKTQTDKDNMPLVLIFSIISSGIILSVILHKKRTKK